MIAGGGRIMPKQYDIECIFQSYKGTEFSFEMLLEPPSSDNKEKEVDKISGNRLINLKILTTNVNIFLECQQYAQEKYFQLKL